MLRELEQSPLAFADRLRRAGRRRAMFVFDPDRDRLRASHPDLEALAAGLPMACPDWNRHAAIFLEVGPETGILYGAFLHHTTRGQAQGGLRHSQYETFGDFIADGLRLSAGMGRKCALAELWWGGGKGIIAGGEGAATLGS
ncbi:MAG: hypothetical protein JRH11_25620, partial [Deltaproteobacteria bacterium]|nr:hypothetical protein [Deltaproteobacteria bacterium]